MKTRSTPLFIVAICFAVLALIITKSSILSLTQEVEALTQRRDKAMSAVQVLKAEWAYFSQSGRLLDLSNAYLAPAAASKVLSRHARINVVTVKISHETMSTKAPQRWKYKARSTIFKRSR